MKTQPKAVKLCVCMRKRVGSITPIKTMKSRAPPRATRVMILAFRSMVLEADVTLVKAQILGRPPYIAQKPYSEASKGRIGAPNRWGCKMGRRENPIGTEKSDPTGTQDHINDPAMHGQADEGVLESFGAIGGIESKLHN